MAVGLPRRGIDAWVPLIEQGLPSSEVVPERAFKRIQAGGDFAELQAKEHAGLLEALLADLDVRRRAQPGAGHSTDNLSAAEPVNATTGVAGPVLTRRPDNDGGRAGTAGTIQAWLKPPNSRNQRLSSGAPLPSVRGTSVATRAGRSATS